MNEKDKLFKTIRYILIGLAIIGLLGYLSLFFVDYGNHWV